MKGAGAYAINYCTLGCFSSACLSLPVVERHSSCRACCMHAVVYDMWYMVYGIWYTTGCTLAQQSTSLDLETAPPACKA